MNLLKTLSSQLCGQILKSSVLTFIKNSISVCELSKMNRSFEFAMCLCLLLLLFCPFRYMVSYYTGEKKNLYLCSTMVFGLEKNVPQTKYYNSIIFMNCRTDNLTRLCLSNFFLTST